MYMYSVWLLWGVLFVLVLDFFFFFADLSKAVIAPYYSPR